jgi:hypothetical protein
MNRSPELCELRIFLQPQDDQIALVAELRIGCAEFEDTEPPFSVRLKQLLLDFDISGLDISPGTRLGEPILTNEVTIKSTEKHEVKTTFTGKGAAQLSVSSAGLKGDLTGGAEGSVNSAKIKSRELSEENQFLRVRALGGDKWRVAEPDGAYLDGTYLDGTKPLCTLKQRVKSNMKNVVVRAEVKQRNLHFESSSRLFGRLANTQWKLFQISVAKLLNDVTQEYEGKISLSEIEVYHEG